MHHVTDRIFSLTTYGMAVAGISVNFESFKSVILFVLAAFLLMLQIYLHVIKIKKEKQNK